MGLGSIWLNAVFYLEFSIHDRKKMYGSIKIRNEDDLENFETFQQTEKIAQKNVIICLP